MVGRLHEETFHPLFSKECPGQKALLRREVLVSSRGLQRLQSDGDRKSRRAKPGVCILIGTLPTNGLVESTDNLPGGLDRGSPYYNTHKIPCIRSRGISTDEGCVLQSERFNHEPHKDSHRHLDMDTDTCSNFQAVSLCLFQLLPC